MQLLTLNLLGGFIALLIGGILYYRNKEQKAFLIIVALGLLDIVITTIRLIL
ncbi:MULTISPECIES: hypothetical protein [Clostridium]|uniref:Uncharacterized protein n=1 Tax=Clostridium cibarium TaxID=2762247 RepID=A0ABR8PTS4_9CLOT|nr:MULTISPECIES: hypothetical protein [Clostridium]MBD7911569.1 hypothetical protein [Clostridium cibarium]